MISTGGGAVSGTGRRPELLPNPEVTPVIHTARYPTLILHRHLTAAGPQFTTVAISAVL